MTYSPSFTLEWFEMILCGYRSKKSVLSNDGYDEFCYNSSRTFNNHSYHFIDVCESSKECISAYRINDGYSDCESSEDETFNVQYVNSCPKIQRHRFRCSNDDPTCLLVTKLGDGITDCKSERDEWVLTGGMKLSNVICNTQSKEDCARVRQYIEASWNVDIKNSSDQQSELSKIPFRALCNTFWDRDSKEDEDIQMCSKWWKCLKDQWQCRSGQCIEIEWVLDG